MKKFVFAICAVFLASLVISSFLEAQPIQRRPIPRIRPPVKKRPIKPSSKPTAIPTAKPSTQPTSQTTPHGKPKPNVVPTAEAYYDLTTRVPMPTDDQDDIGDESASGGICKSSCPGCENFNFRDEQPKQGCNAPKESCESKLAWCQVCTVRYYCNPNADFAADKDFPVILMNSLDSCECLDPQPEPPPLQPDLVDCGDRDPFCCCKPNPTGPLWLEKDCQQGQADMSDYCTTKGTEYYKCQEGIPGCYCLHIPECQRPNP